MEVRYLYRRFAPIDNTYQSTSNASSGRTDADSTAKPPLTERVISFLNDHPDRAYTAAELAAILVGRPRATGGVPWSRTARTRESGWTSQEIDAVLHRLETQDLVRRKGPYWTIGDDVQEVLESEENV